jgi:hypothetical protein
MVVHYANYKMKTLLKNRDLQITILLTVFTMVAIISVLIKG